MVVFVCGKLCHARQKNSARVVLVEDHTMVRQYFAHLVRDELGLTLEIRTEMRAARQR
jgi:DNA-binding NarL/FixJ family response regulator